VTDKLQAARQYAADGLIVTPLNGKHPVLTDWQNRGPLSDAELVMWFGNGNYNIGLPCGVNSRLVAIDVDGAAGKEVFEERAKLFSNDLRNKLSYTRQTRTGSGGYHFLLRIRPDEFPQGIKTVPLWTKGKGEHEEIVLFGDGKQVTSPPSIHPDTGRRYLSNGKPLVEITKQDYLELLSAFGKGERKQQVYRHVAEPNYSNVLTAEKLQKALEIWRPHYRQGRRHQMMLSLTGFSRKAGVPQQDMEQLALMLCKATGDHEVDDRLRTVRDVYARKINQPIAGAQMLRELLE